MIGRVSTEEANRQGKNSRANILHRAGVPRSHQCNELHPFWEIQAAVSGYGKPRRDRRDGLV